ncbi:hypothetical protein GCM10010317_015820 [Streptomyces mirabilis]|uniref:DUF4012 domain-containing protein n=1 Tax=Streptomyces mirabilis TaxID=68239 RepID=UPI0019A0D6B3|nr:DUF4012 domain-containing protein [Streptomyces mirabilis]GHD43362.1 hypothetical protein GCM10010317_015820 [Streptomyces mirabilis]
MTERDISAAVQRRPDPGRDAVRMPGADRSGERAPGRRRVLRKALLAIALLPLVGVVWIGVTGLFARWELLAAQQDLDALRHSVAAAAAPGSASGKAAAPAPARVPEQAVRSAAVHAARAHRLTTGPAWYSAAELPFLGGPVRTVRGAAYAADRLAGGVLSPLTGVLPPSTPHGSGGGMSEALAALQRHGPEIARAADLVAEVRTDVHGLPRSTWLPAADRARAGLQQQLDRLAPVMTDASLAARVLPPMLGTQGQRRYFLAFQNIAEARGTGGLPGAFAVLRADRGRLSFERFGNNTEMETAKPDIDLGAEFNARYAGSDPIHVWPNSNMSPHFPYAARIWAAAWRKHTGERVDGAIAVDPVTLSRLLQVTGPARMADGTELTADNVVDLTERTSYAKYDDVARRKAFFVDAARAAAAPLMGALDDTRRLPALLVAVNDVQRDGRLKVWSAHTGEQRLLESHPYSGTLPNAPGPFAGLVVNNAAGGKLDYYLDRSLTWEAGACSGGDRTVTVTMTLTNRAPASGLPDYVTIRADSPPYRTRPGDNRLRVSYYAGVGATLADATLDGRRALLASGVERGHSVFDLDLELPARSRRTLVLHLLEPHADGTPTLLRQSLVTPMRTTLKSGGACRV